MQSLRWKQKPTIKVYNTAVLSDRGHITERKATLSRYPRVSEVQFALTKAGGIQFKETLARIAQSGDLTYLQTDLSRQSMSA